MQVEVVEAWHEKHTALGMDPISPLLLQKLATFPLDMVNLIIHGHETNESLKVLAATSDAFSAVHAMFISLNKRYMDEDPLNMLKKFVEEDRSAALTQIQLVINQAGGSLFEFWARQKCLAHARGASIHIFECRQARFTSEALATDHRTMRACGWQLRLLAFNSPQVIKCFPKSITKDNFPLIETLFEI